MLQQHVTKLLNVADAFDADPYYIVTHIDTRYTHKHTTLNSAAAQLLNKENSRC